MSKIISLVGVLGTKGVASFSAGWNAHLHS